MRIFVIKNYKGKSAKVFSFFIQLAIVGRAIFSLVNHLIKGLSQFIFTILTPQKKQPLELLVIADPEEFVELGRFLTNAGVQPVSLKQIVPNKPAAVTLKQKTTLIFCQGPSLTWKQIIALTESMCNNRLSFRFHAKNSLSIIGSDSKDTSGEAMANTSTF
jgi:hypothetical protein